MAESKPEKKAPAKKAAPEKAKTTAQTESTETGQTYITFRERAAQRRKRATERNSE